jgi:hypothetical protein
VGIALAAALLVAVPASAGPGRVTLINALEFDELGNTLGGSALSLNGRPFAIGDRVEAGVLTNTSSRPVILAFSNGRLLQLEAGAAEVVDAAAAPVQQCICYCGGEIFAAFPDTTEAACQKHNGEKCLKADGKTRSTLANCALTWVSSSATPVDSGPAEH